jgi:hypothetical protein
MLYLRGALVGICPAHVMWLRCAGGAGPVGCRRAAAHVEDIVANPRAGEYSLGGALRAEAALLAFATAGRPMLHTAGAKSSSLANKRAARIGWQLAIGGEHGA